MADKIPKKKGSNLIRRTYWITLEHQALLSQAVKLRPDLSASEIVREAITKECQAILQGESPADALERIAKERK